MARTNYLEKLRNGAELTGRQQIAMIINLSIPAVLAQISTVIMEYIDASMVGALGANASASIGLVASTTWLVGGLLNAAAMGFSVQVAHRVGAKEDKSARSLVKHGLLFTLAFALILMSIGLTISSRLPVWLGADESIRGDATAYFAIFAAAMPMMEMVNIAGGMLQNSGNMKVPSVIHVLMCVLDVCFNSMLIFPTRAVSVLGLQFTMPGAGLGVAGAALGTALAELVGAALMLYFLLVRSEKLHIRKEKYETHAREELVKAIKIGVPVAIESSILSGAQIVCTRIVSPLGNVSIAANSLSVTAEGLCYMPGYGISAASTAVIGQAVGAKRHELERRLSYTAVALGMFVMTVIGVLMYIFAPQMIGILSPDPAVRALGAKVLRIEAFAEPWFAASIVATGVFRGMADTLVPSILNLVSMWFVRIPLAAILAPRIGLEGVWIAMATELTVRGLLFLARLWKKMRKQNIQS